MAELEVRVSPYPVCDFCSEVEPRYLEDCETFMALPLDPSWPARSRGAWASCVPCHTLILARKWKPLQQRAVDAMLRKYPKMPKSRVQHGVELIHAQFRNHRPVEDLNP